MSTQQKKKTFYLVLPFLILPFLALGFWALGGGKGKVEKTIVSKGLNTALPEANFKNEKPQDKLSLYDQQKDDDSLAFPKEFAELAGIGEGSTPKDQEDKIEEKLGQIQREINKPEEKQAQKSSYASLKPQVSSMSADVQRLEYLMKNLQSGDEEDSEMKQLSSVMDKILDLQYPERVKERYKSILVSPPDSLYKGIPAVIAEDQKVREGSVVKLKLADSIRIKGYLIPKGHLIYGAARMTNQRLLLEITTVRLGNAILPVSFTVFDTDAMAGINVPEALVEEAARGGAVDAISDLQVFSTDPSVGAQVASSGINAARSLLRKRVKRVKVKLKADYPVLLRNNFHGRQ
jgi:hypothetical protein